MTMTELTMGPIYYLWDGPKWRDFYLRIADEAPVDRVVLGETVCSKRQHFIEPHLVEVVERLERAGKTVVFSSLALVTLERESRIIRDLIDNSDHQIEVNDLSAIGLIKGRRHLIGPLVNVYNSATARLLAQRGAERICLPPELPFTSVSQIAADGTPVTLEVFGFGRIPLAISARCAHARSKGKTKDNCQFVCGDEPDGLSLKTLERQSFLVLNGVQTMSHTCQALLLELEEIRNAGIRSLRLSPQDCDMVGVAKIFREALDGLIDPQSALHRLGAIYPMVPFSNGFHHAKEGAAWIARAKSAAFAR
ncbi:MAG: U32 family peptidase [Alphaproteobacteria bacterium]|jgi:O2-independent ubiquinone biosynthesis protein UbiV|nr:U32 family peptidase [Alphaproteobacteria bacterium]MBU1552746.1 U32 family peptidase [Alphaproteobacteria bacterium]MBU2337590.1 U32 family peptidase [Alphaproteobacteria bacterium]MBU2387270.1 U32 family peptidase [Alphaproteobacteria bacterium]